MRSVDSVLENTDEYHLTIIDNSCGGLDKQLALYAGHSAVTIYRSDKNLGKPRAFMRYYSAIMANSRDDKFVSLDPDIEVPPGWLETLLLEAATISDHAILAPLILRHDGESSMHVFGKGTKQLSNTLFYNRHTAGPLFLLDRAFFDSVGGYDQTQLYGIDDGRLCAAAARAGLFVGITTAVSVVHHNTDSTEGYNEWKRQNIKGDATGKGYWDQ